LHLAAHAGGAPAANALLLACSEASELQDIYGRTPTALARRRGDSAMLSALGESGGQAEAKTVVVVHPLCERHHTCPAPISRASDDIPPENVLRLGVLCDKDVGVLRAAEFENVRWLDAPRATISDLLRCHEYSYLEKLRTTCERLSEDEEGNPIGVGNLDCEGGDTVVTKQSYEAALRASGSVVEAVDQVMSGQATNAFCAVRPPGHHTGPGGIVPGHHDPVGSHGFCLVNNVATGAAYALNVYRNQGIQKVALVDFDVHHGNGTEAMCDGVLPKTLKKKVNLMDCEVTINVPAFRPWLDDKDPDRIFFASTHGYGQSRDEGPRSSHFFPGTGSTKNTRRNEDAATHRKTWQHFEFDPLDSSTHGEKGPWVLDVGFAGPCKRRKLWRSAWRDHILPAMAAFEPDMIFISAGFDAHRRDGINLGFICLEDEDFSWLTRELVKLANKCCQGRVVSVLEGGYRVQGLTVSPFGRSVTEHMRELSGATHEVWDAAEGEFERAEEVRLEEERLAHQMKMREAAEAEAQAAAEAAAAAAMEADAKPEAANAEEDTIENLFGEDVNDPEPEPDAKRQRMDEDAE